MASGVSNGIPGEDKKASDTQEGASPESPPSPMVAQKFMYFDTVFRNIHIRVFMSSWGTDPSMPPLFIPDNLPCEVCFV